MKSFEKLGVFYLGRRVDAEGTPRPDAPLLYESKDLTTHAVCVGMTGSGKTGLCVSLLEEAAIDGIPAIAIDPKGDLTNLALAFPDLAAADFAPWVDPDEAGREGVPVEEYAGRVAERWRRGLAEWDEDGERIRSFRSAVDLAIYTPGSTAGLPLRVLRSFSAPGARVADDTEAVRDRIAGTVSSLLGLLGMSADPIRSREHILLSTILDRAWSESRDLELSDLIRAIQTPPFDRVGVMDLESFYPAPERFELAIMLNNLLASPGYAAWMQGEPLDVQRLLFTTQGRPRLSVISIAHLSEPERMFFVTLLLHEVLSWVRSQSGTSSLRAILYMDEVFGYFPPSANPPSKTPMLTLLKQARAYGLGVALATQNPVDLDYKGLSNAGTWFLGRLQTERDKTRVLEGLEGASAAAGRGFDRARMESTLAGLSSRVFLMNNVHEDEPVLFHTRWALSYLRGPLTRDQIRALGRTREPEPPRPSGVERVAPPDGPAPGSRPVLPPGIDVAFLHPQREAGTGETLRYRPGLLAPARLHYVDARRGLDFWEELWLLAPLVSGPGGDPWEAASTLAHAPAGLDREPVPGAGFEVLPPDASREKNYAAWQKALESFLYREREVTLWSCRALLAVSRSGESEGDFRARLAHESRERRDEEVEALKRKYAPKLASLEDRVGRAEQRTERERSQYEAQRTQTAISVGATLLGALFGRKLIGAGTVGRASTAARGAARAARERGDIARAVESAESLKARLDRLESELAEEIARVQESFAPERIQLETIALKPRKSDISAGRPSLVWIPWWVDERGLAAPGFP